MCSFILRRSYFVMHTLTLCFYLHKSLMFLIGHVTKPLYESSTINIVVTIIFYTKISIVYFFFLFFLLFIILQYWLIIFKKSELSFVQFYWTVKKNAVKINFYLERESCSVISIFIFYDGYNFHSFSNHS